MATARFGICHICGNDGKLSYEHVPPEAAFNNHRILTLALINFSVLRT